MIFAFTSTSSAATIPLSKECADELGAESDVSSFVIPLGATINMDGTAIYQCVATIFLATCCGMTLTLGQMVTIVVTATLASIGTAGTPGAGMIMLAMVLEAMNIPVDMIMIIYGIDRLFDMGRTCLNITGDISCALLRHQVGEQEGARLPSKFSARNQNAALMRGGIFRPRRKRLGLHFNAGGAYNDTASPRAEREEEDDDTGNADICSFWPRQCSTPRRKSCSRDWATRLRPCR